MSEANRENNLNTRGTAVAAAAGLIVTLASGVANTIFREVKDPWVDITGGFFLIALSAVTASILFAVLGVLKPKGISKGDTYDPSRKYLARGLIAGTVDLSDSHEVERWYMLHAPSAIASWLRRNVEKQLYLSASYVSLAIGIAVFGVTAVLLAIAPVRPPSEGNDGDAGGEIAWYTVFLVLAFAAGVAGVAFWRLHRRVKSEVRRLRHAGAVGLLRRMELFWQLKTPPRDGGGHADLGSL